MELGFRQLRVIRAIADTGTLTAAAARLGMAQPSITESLRRAERAAGGPLFHRDQRGARCTPLGELVVAHARAVLDALERLENAAERRGVLPDPVRVGATTGMLVGGLTVAVPTVLGTGVEVRGAVSAGAALDLLADQRLEAALLVDFPGHDHARPTRVLRAAVAVEPLFISIAEHHRLAGRREVALSELANERWVSADTGGEDFVDYLTASCAAAGFTAPVDVLPLMACLQLCELGQGVFPTLAGSRRRAGLRLLPLRNSPLRITTRLYWHADGPINGPSAAALWAELARTQRTVVQDAESYQDWLMANPRWATIPDFRVD